MKCFTAIGAAVLMAGLGAMAPAFATGTPALYTVVPGLALTPLTALPPAPAAAAERGECAHFLASPTSEAAGIVSAAGWAVTGEAAVGPYQAVAFVGRMTAGTSGSCEMDEGNIALFDGATLVAIAYARRGAALSIGGIAPLEPRGIRIWTGDFLPRPVAELHVAPDGAVLVTPLSAEESRCQGRVKVPNVYDLPIDVARRRLIAAGWRPVPRSGPSADGAGREATLAARVPEVESCAGTGFGFCAFEYDSAAASLTVITAGEDAMPPVTDYRTTCKSSAD
ncbi:hypothetical protein [Zavarzinia aquatilis]|uniref:PASTA domain-containing protein n=1 Tax=Zavarzinia aquatilis TaxID=2211142 RepID=A0A317EGR0_9PROT|nr:hypothetical protein [Zavarzinia aquatilis]PWR25476.1 hypothetical protein DKG74_00410 [Zavarzinia aquatilis]